MNCNYQTLFIILVGAISSQYLVLQFTKNQLCRKNLENTLQAVWKRYYKEYACQNYDLWKQNNAASMKRRLDNEKQILVMLFYLWNMLWVIMLCFCLPRFWALSLLMVMTTYGLIVLTVSFMVYYWLVPKLERHPDTYVPYFHI